MWDDVFLRDTGRRIPDVGWIGCWIGMILDNGWLGYLILLITAAAPAPGFAMPFYAISFQKITMIMLFWSFSFLLTTVCLLPPFFKIV
jgi:hypothetical protein